MPEGSPFSSKPFSNGTMESDSCNYRSNVQMTVRILSLTTWYLIPASCSTTMSITHAIRPVRKPIRPHTTQRLISRQRKLWNTRQRKREEREGLAALSKRPHVPSIVGPVRSHTIYHVTHPPLLLQKQLVLDVIIVQTLGEHTHTHTSVYIWTGTKTDLHICIILLP